MVMAVPTIRGQEAFSSLQGVAQMPSFEDRCQE
jgi:hypothetical protein